MTIRIEALSKHSYRRPVLDRLSLTVPDGGMFALIGPPGGGRGNLLRLIAGLEQADSGQIFLDGVDIGRLPPRCRRFAALFQHDPLFSHATVAEAVGAAIQPDAGMPPPDGVAVSAWVGHLLNLVGLARQAGASPAGLRPQQRQRLAVARALAPAPRVLLVGHPAPGLESGQRPPPRRWLRDLHDRLGLTTIFIAADAAEAMAIATGAAVLRDGRLEQAGSPRELQDSPATPLVAELFGAAMAPLPAVQRGFPWPPTDSYAASTGGMEVVRPATVAWPTSQAPG